MQQDAGGDGLWISEIRFLRRVLILAGVAALAFLLWKIRSALLLAFGGVVVAVLLLAVAAPLERWLGLRRIWSLAAVGAALALVLALAGTLAGGQVRMQVAQLGARLPEAARVLEERFGIQVPIPGSGQAQPPMTDGGREGRLDGSLARDLAQRAAGIGYVVVEALSALVLVLAGGFFIAADPARYRRGIVTLLPKAQHARVDEALCASGRALHVWLSAQLLSMLLVGLLSGLGTWAIGLPAPLALGLFAGLVDFVPIIGPVIGAAPALLLALGQGWDSTLWTAVLYIGVQQLEANLIFPMLGQRMVRIPSALMLFAVVAAGTAFGLGGTILAVPLTVVAFVLVQKLYVQDTLGEQVTLPGQGS